MLSDQHKELLQLSDSDLIERYRNSHDAQYVGVLYKRYSHLVFGLCFKYFKREDDAQDASMEVFENLLELLKKHHVETFAPWLYRVATNHCLMLLRKKNKHTTINLENNLSDIHVENDENLHLSDKSDEKELSLIKLEDAIGKLKDEQKTCVELFYLKGNSYVEVAELTGFSLNQVKSHIQNGKRNLKLIMEQEKLGND